MTLKHPIYLAIIYYVIRPPVCPFSENNAPGHYSLVIQTCEQAEEGL